MDQKRKDKIPAINQASVACAGLLLQKSRYVEDKPTCSMCKLRLRLTHLPLKVIKLMKWSALSPISKFVHSIP